LNSLLECLQFANEILGTLLGLHFLSISLFVWKILNVIMKHDFKWRLFLVHAYAMDLIFKTCLK
jgi:hypothetical protein